jgi:hypothetical protein
VSNQLKLKIVIVIIIIIIIGNHEVKELQKTAILGTAHIHSDTIPATLYSLGTWFVSGIYV